MYYNLFIFLVLPHSGQHFRPFIHSLLKGAVASYLFASSRVICSQDKIRTCIVLHEKANFIKTMINKKAHLLLNHAFTILPPDHCLPNLYRGIGERRPLFSNLFQLLGQDSNLHGATLEGLVLFMCLTANGVLLPTLCVFQENVKHLHSATQHTKVICFTSN